MGSFHASITLSCDVETPTAPRAVFVTLFEVVLPRLK